MNIKMLFLIMPMVFFRFFGAQSNATDKPIMIFVHKGLSKAEMHCKDINKVFWAQRFDHIPTPDKAFLHVFQCGVDDVSKMIVLLQAITEAESAAKAKNMCGDSQWIKKPGCPVVLHHVPAAK